MENELKLLLNNTSLPNLSNKLSFGKRGTGGRNNTGRITVRHRGGGHKRRILIVDYTGHVGLYAD
jgi:ribosomal protein L2